MEWCGDQQKRMAMGLKCSGGSYNREGNDGVGGMESHDGLERSRVDGIARWSEVRWREVVIRVGGMVGLGIQGKEK